MAGRGVRVLGVRKVAGWLAGLWRGAAALVLAEPAAAGAEVAGGRIRTANLGKAKLPEMEKPSKMWLEGVQNTSCGRGYWEAELPS